MPSPWEERRSKKWKIDSSAPLSSKSQPALLPPSFDSQLLQECHEMTLMTTQVFGVTPTNKSNTYLVLELGWSGEGKRKKRNKGKRGSSGAGRLRKPDRRWMIQTLCILQMEQRFYREMSSVIFISLNLDCGCLFINRYLFFQWNSVTTNCEEKYFITLGHSRLMELPQAFIWHVASGDSRCIIFLKTRIFFTNHVITTWVFSCSLTSLTRRITFRYVIHFSITPN